MEKAAKIADEAKAAEAKAKKIEDAAKEEAAEDAEVAIAPKPRGGRAPLAAVAANGTNQA